MKIEKGFALIECLIVLVVVGILAAVSFSLYVKQTEKARSVEAITTVETIKVAEEAHKLDKGDFVAADNTQQINQLLGMDIQSDYYEYQVTGVTDDNFLVIAKRIGLNIDDAISSGSLSSESIVVAMDRNGAATSGGGGSGGSGTGSGGTGDSGTGSGSSGSGGTGDSGTGSGGSSGSGSITGGFSIAYSIPSSLEALGNNGLVTLGWKATTAGDEVGYNIYRKTEGQEYQKIYSNYPFTYFPDKNVINNTPYYYEIKAVYSDGKESESSTEVYVTPSASSEYAVKMGLSLTILTLNPASGVSPFIEDIGSYISTNNIPLGFGTGVGDGTIAWFDPNFEVICINKTYYDQTQNVLASFLAHEGTHAWYDGNNSDAETATLAEHSELTLADLHISVSPGDSIDQEYHAFLASATVWSIVSDGTNPDQAFMLALMSQGEDEAKEEVRQRYLDSNLPEY